MQANVKPDNQNLRKVEEVLNEMEQLVGKYLTSLDETYKDNEEYLILDKFRKSVLKKFKIEINASSDLLDNYIFFETMLSNLQSMAGSFRTNVYNPDHLKTTVTMSNMVQTARKINEVTSDLLMMRATALRIEEQIEPAIHKALEDVRVKVGQMDNVLLAIETNKTDEIYINASNHFGKLAWNYERAFYVTLVVSIILFGISLFFPELNKNSDLFLYVKYFLAKFILFATTITLCTIFGRKGAHFRKLQDQAYQTHLELSAFPLHTNRLPAEDKNFLIKELALKYFGKEIDQTQNDKVGDLMKDQITSSTELIRASAEMLKAKNGAKDE
ncbi:hypothetical protein ABFP33_07070 [Acinetobacter bereziniae]|uniref:hypothetical protein n=1 Tax=Acinetobacter bereziniae TaxID=106648 RepID=UPI0032150955